MICDSILCAVLLLWTLSNNGVHSRITKKPKDTEVRIGDSTSLNCSFSDTSEPKSWYHYPVGRGANDMRYVYSNEELYPPYNARFRLDTASSDGAFNLVMNQVESQDAGKYVCQNAGDPATAQLIVLESTPHCMSNINSNGLIGPNSCGLQKEMIHLSCSISYTGNIPPKLQWTRVKSGKSIPIDESRLSCLPSDGRITCNYTVEADIEFDGSHFICQTNRATNTQYSCSTESVIILYSTENKTKITKSIGDEVSCPIANTSSLDCSYMWIWYDGDLGKAISKNTTLKIDREGLHRCEARCTIKDFNCKVITTLLKASAAPDALTTYANTGLIIGCILLGLGLGLGLICSCAVVIKMRHSKTARRRKIVREQFAGMIKLLQTEDQHRKNAAEIETLKAELMTKNNEADDLKAEIKSKSKEIDELRIQVDEAKEPNKPRLLPMTNDIEAMGTCSDDQPPTSNDCSEQSMWMCKKCQYKNTCTYATCKICNQCRESQ